MKVDRDALAYQFRLGDQWNTSWAVHIRMWSLARLATGQSAAVNTSRCTLVKLASEIAYLAGGLQTQRAWLGMVIDGMGSFSDQTSAAEQFACDVLGKETYAEAENRGSRLSPSRFELQRTALGELPINVTTVDHLAAKSTSGREALAKAEQKIAILAAAEWPNSAIGARRRNIDQAH